MHNHSQAWAAMLGHIQLVWATYISSQHYKINPSTNFGCNILQIQNKINKTAREVESEEFIK